MANMTGLSVEVPAPPHAPYEHGLFSVAPATTPADPHWSVGASWRSRACQLTRFTGDPCVQDAPAPITVDTDFCDVMNYEPVWVYTYATPSAMAVTRTDGEAEARDVLAAGEQFGVEQALWALLGPAVTEVATTNINTGLAYVEQRLAEVYGGRGIIHMSRFAATLVSDRLELSGARLVTKAGGTPVVAGGGYGLVGGAVPATVGIYGTGPLVVLAGAAEVEPALLDRSVNNVSLLAFKPYVVGWDCAAVGTTVTL